MKTHPRKRLMPFAIIVLLVLQITSGLVFGGDTVQGIRYSAHNLNPHVVPTYRWGIAKGTFFATSFFTTTHTDHISVYYLDYVDVPIKDRRSDTSPYVAIYSDSETNPEKFPKARNEGGEIGRTHYGQATGHSWNGFSLYRFRAKGDIALMPNKTYWVVLCEKSGDETPFRDSAGIPIALYNVYATKRATEGGALDWIIHGQVAETTLVITGDDKAGAWSWGGDVWFRVPNVFAQIGIVVKGNAGRRVATDNFDNAVEWPNERLGIQQYSWLANAFTTDFVPEGMLYAVESLEMDMPTFDIWGGNVDDDPAGFGDSNFVAIYKEKGNYENENGILVNGIGPGEIVATFSRTSRDSESDSETGYVKGNDALHKRKVFSPVSGQSILLSSQTKYYLVVGNDDDRRSEEYSLGDTWSPIMHTINEGDSGDFSISSDIMISDDQGSSWDFITITNARQFGDFSSSNSAPSFDHYNSIMTGSASLKFEIRAVVVQHPETVEKGELNFDRGVNILDLILINGHLNGTHPLPPGLLSHADINSDGRINRRDKNLIINLLLGR